MARGTKINFLQSEFNTVILKNFDIAKLTLWINFTFFEDILNCISLPYLYFFNESIKFAFAWLYYIFVIFVVPSLDVVIFTIIFCIEFIC